MGDVRQDAAFLDFDLALHAEEFEENFDTSLCRKNLSDYGVNSAEGPLENLHLATNLDLCADFHRFCIHHNLAQGFDNILPDNRCDASKLDDVGNSMACAQMTVLATVVEAREQITWKHCFGDTNPTAAPRTLKSKHRTKNFRANIPQNTPLSRGFLTRFAFDAKPLEFLIFKIIHQKSSINSPKTLRNFDPIARFKANILLRVFTNIFDINDGHLAIAEKTDFFLVGEFGESARGADCTKKSKVCCKRNPLRSFNFPSSVHKTRRVWNSECDGWICIDLLRPIGILYSSLKLRLRGLVSSDFPNMRKIYITISINCIWTSDLLHFLRRHSTNPQLNRVSRPQQSILS